MTARKKPTTAPAPLIDEEGEVRELTEEDFRRFRPMSERPDLLALVKGQGRPPLPPSKKKQRVTMYLDPDVLARLKADGKGWQTRANAALRKALGL
ncbi:BrnA antitoxin family protein [Frigidibacter sp. ROC022]|uniref:BrnA antitoxin family protein n=1 Tax=Frigidibacter sp. ROC022 TaxID=2971796 RepID=UPI00215A3378|nr:BrnA antitoxin family protein [Frigidibacter sp. ROC022]MCR8724002.1 BrnA antitoxin family protein [Frigidibacter sp. ROC022]